MMKHDEERAEDLKSLGFVVGEPRPSSRHKKFRTVVCGRCNGVLHKYDKWGALGFTSPAPTLPLPGAITEDHNLERDKVWLECREHYIVCTRPRRMTLMTQEQWNDLSKPAKEAYRAQIADADEKHEKELEAFRHIHKLYELLSPMPLNDRQRVLREAAFLFRTLGFSEAADAIESPSWKAAE